MPEEAESPSAADVNREREEEGALPEGQAAPAQDDAERDNPVEHEFDPRPDLRGA